MEILVILVYNITKRKKAKDKNYDIKFMDIYKRRF